jgi:UDP-GlcNAc:undecaprenyl-phosphate GlcNAc-1-phosphate transferase
MRTYISLLLLTMMFSWVMTRWLSRVASERGWARRDGDHGNGEGVPRLGGVSVLAAVLLSMLLLFLWDNQVSQRLAMVRQQALGLLGAGLAVFLLGLYDDVRGARPWQKLVVQIAAAVGLYYAGFRVDLLTNPFTHSPLTLGILSLPLTVLWLVAISNAFNLIDGLDGLAAGVGFFATLSLFLLAITTGKSFMAAISVTVAGALLGFLPHNFAPARIYLGDSGALTIGLALGALAVQSSQKGPVLVTLAIPLMIFALPLLDASVTTVRRFLAGHSIFHRDEEHLHHQLVKGGLTTRVAVLVLYGVAAIFALASLLVINYQGALAPLVALLCGILAWVVVSRMQYPEFAELDSHFRQAIGTQRAVLRNQILLRKSSAELHQMASLEEAWSACEQVFSALEFDSAQCRIHVPGNAAVNLAWHSPLVTESAPDPSLWRITLPLQADGALVGEVTLERDIQRVPLLFRMSSLINFLSQDFAACAAVNAKSEAFVAASNPAAD